MKFIVEREGYWMSKPSVEQREPRQIRIEIDDAIADGTYANLAFISSNNSEFILDFARFLPGNTRGKVVTRIVFGPIHAKAFLKSLNESVENFERNFGPIKTETADKNIGFNINTGENQKDKNK